MTSSRISYQKMAEAIVAMYTNGNIEWNIVTMEGVDYTLYSENGGLYIEATTTENKYVDGIIFVNTTTIGGWFFSSEEVTIGNIFRSLYPRKGRYYSNSEYRKKVSGFYNRRPPFRY